MKAFPLPLITILAFWGGSSCQAASTSGNATMPPVDELVFGQTASETAHSLQAAKSDVVTGAMKDTARILLPGGAQPYLGGTLSFKMKIDPATQNYFTVRLWGSETGNSNHLILYCAGKQIGYLHLGDVEALDSASDRPSYPERFFYNTCPLPVSLTKGRTELDCEIRSLGPIWGYGTSFAQYQKPMTQPTRGIYRVYIHLDPCFIPPPDETQGEPTRPKLRTEPGKEVLAEVQKKLADVIQSMLADPRPPTQAQLWFLARAWNIRWTAAYQNPTVTTKAIQTLDKLYAGWIANPSTALNGPDIYNNGWFGFGPAGRAVTLLGDALHPSLDQDIAGFPGVKRRDGWARMFAASRDAHRENRRQYTNQSMITDTFGIYACNRAAAAIDPAKALPETQALHYLYQAAGLEPWLGSEKDGKPTEPLGSNYYQLTQKGLTRELGYVGYYGEVLDWMTAMYDATRPTPDQPGDARIKAQLEKALHARAPFRYPEVDADGCKAMLDETIIGWRDQGHYPSDVVYGQRSTWDATPIEAAAETLDPAAIGYAQQQMADNQFFATLKDKLAQNNPRVTAGLLPVLDQYDLLAAQPASPERLPMTPGKPDFVWSDEENGCVAIKSGADTLYVSLYWRSRCGINSLARIHYITPRIDRIAVASEDVQFTPSGMTYTVPDWTNMGFGNGGFKYPGDWHSARAGEIQPIAKIPTGVQFHPGEENVYAGRGDFYTLRYGPYLIAMNMTANQTYSITPPAGIAKARDLVSGKDINLSSPRPVPARSTVILYFGGK